MATENIKSGKSILGAVLFGTALLVISAGFYSLAVFMSSILVFGCVKSPPDWVYMILFIGFPLPMIFSSIVTPYLYIKNQHKMWILLSIISGIFLSSVIFFIWFLILTQYC